MNMKTIKKNFESKKRNKIISKKNSIDGRLGSTCRLGSTLLMTMANKPVNPYQRISSHNSLWHFLD